MKQIMKIEDNIVLVKTSIPQIGYDLLVETLLQKGLLHILVYWMNQMVQALQTYMPLYCYGAA